MKASRTLLAGIVLLALALPRVQAGLVTATNSGNWFATSVWSNGVLPVAGDDVVILSGKSVMLSNATPLLSSVTNYGTLTFTNWDTILSATNVTLAGAGLMTHVQCISSNQTPMFSNRVYIACDNFTMLSGTLIDVNGKGYTPGGPGTPSGSYSRNGGSYGGLGGVYNAAGTTYGSSNAPTDPGSCGQGQSASPTFTGTGWGVAKGGGVVRIAATGKVTVNGTIRANGGDGASDAGGGSGGSIYITCTSLAGTGVVSGVGGVPSGQSGGGGGGRIALYTSASDNYLGTVTVVGGVLYGVPTKAGATGTIVRLYNGPDPVLTVSGSPLNADGPVPYAYGANGVPVGTEVTNSVTSPADQAAGRRYESIGWSLQTNGVEMISGTSTQAVFTMPATNATLTYYWTNVYQLIVLQGANGTADTGLSGWYTNGTVLTIPQTPGGGSYFSQWTGDVPTNAQLNASLIVVMDRPRTIQANFAASTPVTKTWSGTGNWTNSGNWNPSGMPGYLDSVAITSGTVTLSEPVWVANVLVSNATTLSFANWMTVLNAGDVTVRGTVTHAQCACPVQTPTVSNRVYIACANLTVVTNAQINADERGYTPGGPGSSPTTSRAGGSHGGLGGSGYNAPVATYGNAAAPVDPGSSGQGQGTAFSGTGYGGGAVRITATGRVTVDGTISANGRNPNGGDQGGGSGGSVYITCDTVAGIGIVRAQGGSVQNEGLVGGDPGAGGGGRIAVIYSSASQATVSPKPSVAFSVRNGTPTHLIAGRSGEIGTLYFPDDQLLSDSNSATFNGILTGFSRWDGLNITLNDSLIQFASTNFEIIATNTVRFKRPSNYVYYRPVSALKSIVAGGDVTLDRSPVMLTNAPVFTCGGNFAMSNNAWLSVYAVPTNAAGPDYGALVAVTGDVVLLTTNTWIYPYAHQTNGGGVLFRMRNLSIASSNGFDANAKGFFPAGPGRATANRYGAGYGGVGGIGASGGQTYGSSNAPIMPGSTAGPQSAQIGGAQGGGAIRIEAERTITLDGILTANGNSGAQDGGGGSGGGIYLITRWFQGGLLGKIEAKGGNAYNTSAGNGGGGRIAVAYSGTTNGWLGTLTTNSVACGTSASSGGQYGTVVWRTTSGAPIIDNLTASNVTFESATIPGLLVSAGSTAPDAVAVYWGETDCGKALGSWTHTNTFAGPFSDGQALAANVTGLAESQTYYYRFYATNSIGEYWAEPVKSFRTFASVPVISNAGGASNITVSAADLNGYLSSTGKTPTLVTAYWGPIDGGTNAAAWANTNTFADFIGIGPVTTNISPPTPNVFYYYTYFATNSGGASWATPSEMFMAGEVSLEETKATATEYGEVPGTITVVRASTATNKAITVHLAIAGTAQYGTDYTTTPAGSDVVMSAGVSRVSITVRPIWDSSNESDETVTFALQPGMYVVGTPNSAMVTIANDYVTPGYNTATNPGNWNTPAVWTLGRRPIAGDVVAIRTNVTLSGPTERLSSVTNWSTLVFTNWDTCLSADTIYLAAGSTITHAECYATNQTPLVSNRVYISCNDLVVASGAAINADSKGYYPFGPGTGIALATYRFGGSYGGRGGGTSADAYGTAATPVEPGSSGGETSIAGYGGRGGGAVRIVATSSVTVDGTITVNGGMVGGDKGGGSGGSVYITCQILRGTGIVRGDGGEAGTFTGSAGGGGGRIALVYDSASEAGVSPKPDIKLSVAGGTPGQNESLYGMLGSLWITDTQILPETLRTNFNGIIHNVTSWAPGSLSCSGLVQFASGTGFQLSVTNDALFSQPTNYLYRPQLIVKQFSVGGNIVMDRRPLTLVNTPVLLCGQNLTLTNSSIMSVYSAPTNGVAPIYGGLVSVTGTVFLATNCWVYPYSDPTNGGSVFFAVRDITIQAGAGFNANGGGYIGLYNTAGYGPGTGTGNGTGGGYGGHGYASGTGGSTYGSSNAPVDPGSSGHGQNNSVGATGGGLVWIRATGTIQLNGTITALGNDAPPYCGGGSGGGIYLTCRKFIGSVNGLLKVNGGNVASPSYWTSGGGGGRIAVWRMIDINGQGVVTAVAAGGVGSAGNFTPGYDGLPGTIVWGQLRQTGTIMVIR
jgi:hypothetical protein